MKRTAVVSLPETKTRTRPDRINARVEPIAAHSQLPLHRFCWGAGKGNRARAVVLGAAVRLWRCGVGKVSADITRVKLDCVQTGVHVKPGWIGGGIRYVGVCGAVGAAVISNQED